MRGKRVNLDDNTSNFDLSISDLMAALCCIFVLICISVIIQLNKSKIEFDFKNAIAEKYGNMQNELYLDLQKEFGDDLEKWNAEIDPKTLSIRFMGNEVNFDADKANLKPKYQAILQDFFPRLLNIIYKKEYRDEIEEIRIEGHTARSNLRIKQGLFTESSDYTDGINLSQERTSNVLIYCLTQTKYSVESDWVRKHFVANGYSSSRPMLNEDGTPNWEKSRRVEFRIKTNSDNIIKQYQTQIEGK